MDVILASRRGEYCVFLPRDLDFLVAALPHKSVALTTRDEHISTPLMAMSFFVRPGRQFTDVCDRPLFERRNGIRIVLIALRFSSLVLVDLFKLRHVRDEIGLPRERPVQLFITGYRRPAYSPPRAKIQITPQSMKKTKKYLHIRLFPTREQAFTEMFLSELREKHQVKDATFLVNGALWLQAALHRHGFRSSMKHIGIGTPLNVSSKN